MAITHPHAKAVSDVPSPLLSAEQAGSYLHVHPRTMANWRVLGRGPRYIRSGSRALYRQVDLDAWLDAHTYEHAADERARRTAPEMAHGRAEAGR